MSEIETTSSATALRWTDHEALLWETARVVGALIRGEPVGGIPSRFRLHLAADGSESLIAAAPYSRKWFGAIGDGTYWSSHTLVGGASVLGIVAAAATLGTSSLRTARRKGRAAADASVIWRDFDHGLMHVSTHGFYLEPSAALLAFTYQDVHRADLVGPGAVQLVIMMASGSVETFIIEGDGAEMLFALWAMTCCRSHPQFQQLTWLPPPFLDRVRAAGLSSELGGGSLASPSPSPSPSAQGHG